MGAVGEASTHQPFSRGAAAAAFDVAVVRAGTRPWAGGRRRHLREAADRLPQRESYNIDKIYDKYGPQLGYGKETVTTVKERLNDFKGQVIDIDGIRIQNDKGWFLVRASNTQNQLTCRAEASNKDDLLIFINLIEKQLKLSGVNFSFNVE